MTDADIAPMRMERDALGELAVPATALWGVHTQRAVGNFPLSGRRVHPAIVRALAVVKQACALTNREFGYLPPDIGDALIAAALAPARLMAFGHRDGEPEAPPGAVGVSAKQPPPQAAGDAPAGIARSGF